MKRLLSILLLLSVFIAANSQERIRPFSIGASFYGPVSKFKETTRQGLDYKPIEGRWGTDYMKYWGVSLDFAYRLKIYRTLQFHPSASVFYERHKMWDGIIRSSPIYGGNIPTPPDTYYKRHLDEYGIDVALPVGLCLPVRSNFLEVETGPVLGGIFSRHYTHRHNENDWNYRHFRAKWRFGVAFNFFKGRMYAKATLDLAMSNYLRGNRCRHTMSGGLGWNF